MLNERFYQSYLQALIKGDTHRCRDLVSGLIASGTPVRTLYLDLFQRSMYEVGTLWETNQITVATEHMATAITESLLPLVYPLLFHQEHKDRTALLTCVAGEYHQIGARIVADYLEMLGWHSHTLGANMPEKPLLDAIEDFQPDMLGISVSISFNLPVLERMILTIRERFPEQFIIVGGRAFGMASDEFQPDALQQRHGNLSYVNSLDSLEALVKELGP